jgi:hypothetical protein
MLSLKPHSCRRFGTFGARVWRFRSRRFNGRRFHGMGLRDRRCRGKGIEVSLSRSSLAGKSGACCRDLRLVLRSRGLRRSPRHRSHRPHSVESLAGPRRAVRSSARIYAGRPRLASNLEESRRRRRWRGWTRNRRRWSGAERTSVRRIGFRPRHRRGSGLTPRRWPKARGIRFGDGHVASRI